MQLVFILSILASFFWSFSQPTNDILPPENCLDSIYVPTSFTPNNDGKNDVFSIDFPCPPEKMKFELMNNWGEEIFSTDNHEFVWEGKDEKGHDVPSGVFVWRLAYTFLKKDVERNGQLTLMR